MQNMIPDTPQTIEQLQAWYIAHNLPPEEVTRFFIGKNVDEPRAFGIYRDGNLFIVYKNKDDGSRAIRYSGFDEAFAVNELYERLKREIQNQKARNNAQKLTPEQLRKQKRNSIIICIVVVALIVAWLVLTHDPQKNGYYHAGDTWYYYNAGNWYYYDNYYNDWYYYDNDYDNRYWDDYYSGSSYRYGNGCSDFALTDYYSRTDTDSGWSSSDSWDSGSTDFSSDW